MTKHSSINTKEDTCIKCPHISLHWQRMLTEISDKTKKINVSSSGKKKKKLENEKKKFNKNSNFFIKSKKKKKI